MSLETDVLDYTEEYLRTLTDEELNKLLELCSYYEEQYDIGQKVKKILINSLYGAITKQAFIVYNMFVAGAITSTGRYFIQMLGKYLEDFLQEKLPSNSRYWVYSDTDSAVFDTKICLKTNGYNKVISIGDFYNSLKCDEVQTLSGNLVKKVDNILTLSVSENLDLEYKRIKYVMKHTVSKRMFTIKVKNKSVTVTEDHSLIVLRDGKLIACKAKDIQKEDKICLLQND